MAKENTGLIIRLHCLPADGIRLHCFPADFQPKGRRIPVHRNEVKAENPAPATKLAVGMCPDKFTVYVIQSVAGQRYIGQTKDLQRRLTEHNQSRSRWTKRSSQWQLIYHEDFNDRTSAVRRERYLKSGAGREWLRKLLGL